MRTVYVVVSDYGLNGYAIEAVFKKKGRAIEFADKDLGRDSSCIGTDVIEVMVQ
jgi:hypothetical protein